MKKQIVFLCFLHISCAYSAGYVGVKNFSFNINNVSAGINSSPTLTRAKISLTGVYTTTGCQGNIEQDGKYGFRSIWIGDPITDDGTRLTINIPVGTQMYFNDRNFTVQRVKRIIKDGHMGTWAVMGLYLTNMNNCGDVGASYSTRITFEADISSAISAGTQNLTFYAGYNEPFYSVADAYDDIINRTSIISSTMLSSLKTFVNVPGYCAASTFSSESLEIDHGVMNVANVNGNERHASITYICNTSNLPKVSFSGTSDSFVDVKLCDGVKSRLAQKTVSEG